MGARFQEGGGRVGDPTAESAPTFKCIRLGNPILPSHLNLEHDMTATNETVFTAVRCTCTDPAGACTCDASGKGCDCSPCAAGAACRCAVDCNCEQCRCESMPA